MLKSKYINVMLIVALSIVFIYSSNSTDSLNLNDEAIRAMDYNIFFDSYRNSSVSFAEPPPGFNNWLTYALGNNCSLDFIDYKSLFDDLRPFKDGFTKQVLLDLSRGISN